MKKKKILLIGPIGDFGGRELEVGFIANALNEECDVKICSTVYYTKQSQVFDFVAEEHMFSLAGKVVEKHMIIKLFAFIAYIRFGFKYSVSCFFNNKINKKYASVVRKTHQVIEDLIVENDMIIICAQLSSAYMKEIVSYSFDKNIPVVFRTTGAVIKENFSTNEKIEWLEKVSLYLHHSVNNTNRLVFLNNYNTKIIDQCAFNEKRLFEIPLLEEKVNIFLTISRLVKEKNIDIVIKAFKKIKKDGDKLYVVGNGSDLKNLIAIADGDEDIVFTGFVDNIKLVKYFKIAQCVIISYYEFETGPLTGIEAMSAARIIISSKTGAMEERIPFNKFWYDNSVELLVEQMNSVKKLTKNECFTYSSEIREEYLKGYSIASIKKKYRNVVNETLSSL
ncbi:MAG: hypothetical protein COA88_05720 [Kordia sp.]|nr:MAG: hypothetical protein COA88_05720 [Kordia sp.]